MIYDDIFDDICRHRIHQIWHTWGVMKTTKMNVVDNSALGRKAMAEGRPPKYVTRERSGDSSIVILCIAG